MVALFAAGGKDPRGVQPMLEAAGYDVRAYGSWARFRFAVRQAQTGVLLARWLEVDLPLFELRRMTLDYPWQPLVLITDPEPSNLRNIAGLAVSRVLFWGEEEDRLPEAMVETVQRGFFAEAAHAVRTAWHLPPVLREALSYALEHPPAVLPVNRHDALAPPHTVRALARRLQRSEQHLRHAARRHELDLSRFLDWCLALRALQVRSEPGMTWERAAWRLGFEAVSGLSEHLRRTLGLRPRQIAPSDVGYWFRRFGQLFLVPLLGRPRPRPDASDRGHHCGSMNSLEQGEATEAK